MRTPRPGRPGSRCTRWRRCRSRSGCRRVGADRGRAGAAHGTARRAAHAPAAQTSPCSQAVPQLPQWAGSVDTLVQTRFAPVPQLTSPTGQVHTPEVHVSPAAHACAQAPAVVGIVRGVDAADEAAAVDVAGRAGADACHAGRAGAAVVAAGAAVVAVGLLVHAAQGRPAVGVPRVGRTVAREDRWGRAVRRAGGARAADDVARAAVRVADRGAGAGAYDVTRRARLAHARDAVLARGARVPTGPAVVGVAGGRGADAGVGAADDVGRDRAVGTASGRVARHAGGAGLAARAAVVGVGHLVGARARAHRGAHAIGVPGGARAHAGDARRAGVADLAAAAAVVGIGGGVDAAGRAAGGSAPPCTRRR